MNEPRLDRLSLGAILAMNGRIDHTLTVKTLPNFRTGWRITLPAPQLIWLLELIEAGQKLAEAAERAASSAQPFVTAWEYDAFDDAVDGEKLHADLTAALEHWSNICETGPA